MKRHRLSALFLLLLVLLLPIQAAALSVPSLTGRVNDYAHMFSSQAAGQLENSLAQFEKAESTQIVVLTIPTLEGESLEEYSIKVAEAWKVGWKGSDNGVILLIAGKEHKIRIEVGRGLEGRLTDLVSGRIIRNEIAPRFKAGDFDGGVTAGVAAIMAVVKGEYAGKDPDLRHAGKSAPPIFTMLMFLIVPLVFLGAMSKYLGGAAGAVGLPLVAYLAFPGVSLIVLALLVGAGVLVGLILSILFGSGFGGGGGGMFWGGPFLGGGGGSGGGDDSGGFSGGGGDFGGGGASGDW